MRLLHWTIAVLMIGLIIAGFVMSDMENSPLKFQIYGLHKSFGLAVLGFAILRWLVRISSEVPPMPDVVRWYEKMLARFTYVFMYLALLAMPISGYVMSVAGGYPVSFFGYPVPALFPKNEGLGKIAYETHELLGWVWVALITLHVLGYLKHLIFDRENLLKRIV